MSPTLPQSISCSGYSVVTVSVVVLGRPAILIWSMIRSEMLFPRIPDADGNWFFKVSSAFILLLGQFAIFPSYLYPPIRLRRYCISIAIDWLPSPLRAALIASLSCSKVIPDPNIWFAIPVL